MEDYIPYLLSVAVGTFLGIYVSVRVLFFGPLVHNAVKAILVEELARIETIVNEELARREIQRTTPSDR